MAAGAHLAVKARAGRDALGIIKVGRRLNAARMGSDSALTELVERRVDEPRMRGICADIVGTDIDIRPGSGR